MLVGRLRVGVSFLAVLVGGGRVLLGLGVLADVVVVRRGMMVMSRGVMVGRRLVVMLRGGMLCFIRHRRSPKGSLS